MNATYYAPPAHETLNVLVLNFLVAVLGSVGRLMPGQFVPAGSPALTAALPHVRRLGRAAGAPVAA